MKQVWIIEDEPAKRAAMVEFLSRKGFEVLGLATAEQALAESSPPLAIVTDLDLPGMDGLTFLSRIRERWPALPVIVISSKASVESVLAALKLGAGDFIIKPFDPGELLKSLTRLVGCPASRVAGAEGCCGATTRPIGLVGESEGMRAVYDLISRVAPLTCTVLIHGESGTGKEMVADAIHHLSPRGDKPLVKVNCSILTESLLESELFGHEKGSFTGAISSKPGRFELADQGSIFLDDVDDMPLATQVKLLRVLQELSFERVGGTETITVDVRVIASTKKALALKVKAGSFREDLFFRLNVVPICIPPLRERPDDVPLLIEHFVEKFCRREGRPVPPIAPSIMEEALAYDWPGNVRELENAVERMIALTPSGSPPARLLIEEMKVRGSSARAYLEMVKQGRASFHEAVLQVEKELVSWSLHMAKGNKSQGARLLKMKRSTFCDIVKRCAQRS